METRIGELQLSSPIVINAMTGGGGDETMEINRQLASVAKSCGTAMAVGSQMSAIKDPNQEYTYRVVREENPNGIIFANLGSEATVEQAQKAVDMLEADALQIHLNVIQELVMPEGDREFSGMLERIENIVQAVSVPVIVKEVGFGMSKDTAQQLVNIGVENLDVGGFGGTNFAQVENVRRARKLAYFNDWGITTAASIAEVKQQYPLMNVIASGGITTPLEMAKSIALGASAVGIAGHLLKLLMEEGAEAVHEEVETIHDDFTMMMTALGTTTIEALKKTPVVISGETYHWLHQRGMDTKKFSCRSPVL